VRAVVDANVWVSGLIVPAGVPGRLVAAFRAGRFDLVTSVPLLDELLRVLSRPKFARYGMTAEAATQFVTMMRERAKVVEITEALAVCRDATDNRLIETALVGIADRVVSGDKDVRRDPAVVAFLTALGIPVVSAREFVEELG
jgi:putative PIN family toxin of toxin-antitoxin system